ncbi:Protease 2 [Serratia fonticola]|uniref:Protease 2 n=1 Tax=Serratia fonticola TaxID=47917 RepID=A0A4V6KWX5_SERFO|nr:Protease 2 [Serratia fonticola]
MDAGHGGKSGRFKAYEDIALEYAFILGAGRINHRGQETARLINPTDSISTCVHIWAEIVDGFQHPTQIARIFQRYLLNRLPTIFAELEFFQQYRPAR